MQAYFDILNILGVTNEHDVHRQTAIAIAYAALHCVERPKTTQTVIVNSGQFHAVRLRYSSPFMLRDRKPFVLACCRPADADSNVRS